METMQIGTFEAKNKLSALLERVERGEVIQIMRRGKPIAELRPLTEGQSPRPRFGSEKGLVLEVSETFSATVEEFEDYLL